MCDCKAKIMIGDEFKTYTFNEIRLLKDKWFREYRIANRSDEMTNDRSYDQFVESVERLLERCKCTKDIFEEPGKDVTQNILNAKERRSIGQSPWQIESEVKQV